MEPVQNQVQTKLQETLGVSSQTNNIAPLQQQNASPIPPRRLHAPAFVLKNLKIRNVSHPCAQQQNSNVNSAIEQRPRINSTASQSIVSETGSCASMGEMRFGPARNYKFLREPPKMPDQILQAPPVIQTAPIIRDSDGSGEFTLDDEQIGEDDDETDARAIHKCHVRTSASDVCSQQSKIPFKLPPRLRSFEEKNHNLQ